MNTLLETDDLSLADVHGSVRVLWLFAQSAIIACDIAEVIGGAIALNLLFHIPPNCGCGFNDTRCVCGVDAAALGHAAAGGRRDRSMQDHRRFAVHRDFYGAARIGADIGGLALHAALLSNLSAPR